MELHLTRSTRKATTPKDAFATDLFSLLGAIHRSDSQSAIRKAYPEIEKLGLLGSMSKKEISSAKDSLKSEIFRLAFTAQSIFFDAETRDQKGMFYTPASQVAPMLCKAASKKVSSLCEPACGTSLLTLTFLSSYIDRHGDVPKVFGFDVCQTAVHLSNIFVRALMQIYLGADSRSFHSNIKIVCSGIFEIPFKGTDFDLILMNPPYVKGASKGRLGIDKVLTSYGTSNLTNVFISYAFNMLSKAGKAVLVLGEPVKWGNSYSRIVNDILNKFHVSDYMHRLEAFDSINYEVFAVALQRDVGNNAIKASHNHCRKINTLALNLSDSDRHIFERIFKRSEPLSEFIEECTRGVYVKKETLRVGKTFISSGSDMNAYCADFGFSIPKSGASWKRIFSQERIIVKAKRGKLVHAAIAPGEVATTDNIINLIPKNISQDAMLGYLNSSFVSYFLTEGIFCGNSESARILDRVYLEKIAVLNLSEIQWKSIQKNARLVKRYVDDLRDKGNEVWHAELGRDQVKIGDQIKAHPMNVALKFIDEIILDHLGLEEKQKEDIQLRYGRVITYKPALKLKKVG